MQPTNLSSLHHREEIERGDYILGLGLCEIYHIVFQYWINEPCRHVFQIM